MTASQLQSHKAQMTEWIPASPMQRLVAQTIDGMVVGCLSTFVIFLAVSVVDIALGGKMAQSNLSMSHYIMFILAGFGLGFLDCLFVCIGPIIIVLDLLFLATQKHLPFTWAALTSPSTDFPHAILAAALIVTLVNWLYHCAMESSPKESTLGKTVFRLRVTDTNGSRLSFARAALRHFLRFIPSTIVVAALAALAYLSLCHDPIWLRAVNALLAIIALVLGMLATANPGAHNAFAHCIVTDNHLYSPRLDMIAPQMGPEHDGP